MQKQSEVKEVRETKKSNSNKLTFKEKKEFESLEIEIDELEKEKKDLLEKMNSGSGDSDELVQWSNRYQEVSDLLDEKSMRWLELSEKEG